MLLNYFAFASKSGRKGMHGSVCFEWRPPRWADGAAQNSPTGDRRATKAATWGGWMVVLAWPVTHPLQPAFLLRHFTFSFVEWPAATTALLSLSLSP